MWKRGGDFEKSISLFAFKFASRFSGRPGFSVLCLAEQNHSSPSQAMHWGGLQSLLSKRSATIFLVLVSSSQYGMETNGVAESLLLKLEVSRPESF